MALVGEAEFLRDQSKGLVGSADEGLRTLLLLTDKSKQ
jgi:hypothetical protein